MFKTELLRQHSQNRARSLRVETAHGSFLTPTFMPVGTRAYVNQLTADQLQATGSQIILGGNTYHMLCTPGLETITRLGGMHKMMSWNGPMLTDSGGYQVYSLSCNDKKICKIDEDGAHFKHPETGEILHLTPQSSLQAQKVIGADIIMAFDQCTEDRADRLAVIAAMERTHRWLIASKAYHQQFPHSVYGFSQALFGIIQGAYFRDLREQSAEFIVAQDLDGIGIGGETIGYDMEKTRIILDWLHPILPQNKIRYTMGVGLHPQDLIDVVKLGVDIFDCVAPTRNARHGALYCGQIKYEDQWVRFENLEDRGRILIKKSIYRHDDRPIMADCGCYTCQHFSRGYLHFLFKSGAAIFSNLASIHNIHVMQAVCDAMRSCIR